MALLSFLDRDAHGRQTGLQPLDGAASRAVRASVHRPGLCVQRVQSADDQAHRHHAIGAGRLEAHRARLDLLHRDCLPRRLGGGVRPLGRGRRPAPRDVHRGACAGPADSSFSAIGVYIHTLWLIYLGYGVLGGCRARHRLHLAGLDADQMVPRPSGHGDRHGHHGLRRRRLHRLAAVGLADEQVHHPDPCRRRRDLHRAGLRLLLLHDRRLDHRARAGAGLEAGRLCRAGAGAEADHQERRLRL